MKKKVISILAGIMLVLFVVALAGCATTSKSGNKGKAKQPPKAKKKNKRAEPKKIARSVKTFI